MLSFLLELSEFIRVRKKYWLFPVIAQTLIFGSLVVLTKGRPSHFVSIHCSELRSAMIVLGISAYYHDSAAALVRDGSVVAAAQEERFSRKIRKKIYCGAFS